jgi:hypothetical protein
LNTTPGWSSQVERERRGMPLRLVVLLVPLRCMSGWLAVELLQLP